ncbi:GNAT family N-acetyltransferase [Tenacibaculum sp. S7007]|uniref:GNAT family N-acetyltransferase n=1 Tax=Tenacibaculum pelagium TaxID=2759527 RepID=A0A839ANZ9_9FLAO|nr:GNAT family N-acetyltransferase [Tenacibaculum pelagium]MBA6155451.1 GNAT family N-acetyltransferase [Tenacibaculum pelagium]
MITVKEITAADTYKIRLEVLRKNIDLPYKFDGDFDKETFHLGGYYEEELVGIATFMKNDIESLKGSQYQLRGMATTTKARGKGLGKHIINKAVAILKEKQIDFLWCNARKEAVLFYEKLSFAKIGAEFIVEKVGPHYKMYTKI